MVAPLVANEWNDDELDDSFEGTPAIPVMTDLQTKLHKQILMQQKVSYMLQNFFACFAGLKENSLSGKEKLAQLALYQKSIVFANKCLLEACKSKSVLHLQFQP